jgi:hypothetical protein
MVASVASQTLEDCTPYLEIEMHPLKQLYWHHLWLLKSGDVGLTPPLL